MDGEFEKQLGSGLILVPQTDILRHTGLLSLVKPPTAWSAARHRSKDWWMVITDLDYQK
jgi:hypothetical protein